MITITLDHGLTEEAYPEIIAAVRADLARNLFNDEPQTHTGFELHVPITVPMASGPKTSQIIGYAFSNAPESGFSETLFWQDGEIVGSEGWDHAPADEDLDPWPNGRYHDTLAWYESQGFTPPAEWKVV